MSRSALLVIVSLVSVSDLRLRRRDLSRQRRDGSEYFGHRLRRDPLGSERVGQVPGHQAEVVHGDAAALMHLPHRRARVGLGPAEGGREELDLFALEAVHVRSGEEARQLIIGKHTNVEVLDDDFDRLVPADPVVDADRLGLAEPGWTGRTRA